MTRIRYRELRLRESSLQTIAAIDRLIEEYAQNSLSLTVRQIHYQFVARGWMPNSGTTYSHIQDCVNKGRLAGLLDWEAIEDRGRTLRGVQTQVSPAHAVAGVRRDYRLDLWADQPFRPEVWIEKQALEGVIEQICVQLRVDFYAQKGYNSQSEQWRAGQRFADYVRRGQRPIVLHLGDHDASGVHMTEDNRQRLEEFAGVPVMVQRLALNYDQIEQYNPPENFAKESDSRREFYERHMARVGGDPSLSWELDALDPLVVRRLISDAVLGLRDPDRWDRALAQEIEDQEELDDVIESLGGES